MAGTNFDPIRPGDVDSFVFDFTAEIGATGLITTTAWTCAVALVSTAQDPDAATRLVGSPTYASGKTACLVGTMIEGVIYTLSASVDIDDGRSFSKASDLLCAAEPESSPPPVPGVTTFDFARWITAFPEFSSTDPDTAASWFVQATVLHPNDGSGPIKDPAQQTEALYLLTAHLAALAPNGSVGVPSWVLGRITGASQGPISVQSEGFQFKGSLGAWYGSTRYGALYWIMMAKYRTFRWRPGPPSRFSYGLPYRRRLY